jgi:sarcosine oxidase
VPATTKDVATADVAVVGLGAMGSAVLYQLAKRGVRAIGLDRHAPPHALGSSHGETRITRQAVGEGKAYVPFVLAAHRIWRELEAQTGEALLTACGTLLIQPEGQASHLGMSDFVGRSIRSAQAFGIPHEALDGAEVARRFPQFLGLTGREVAAFEPGGGFLAPERCIAAQLRQAAALGADVRTGEAVLDLAQDGAGVRIETAAGTVRADRAVVAAGAWTPSLLGAPFDRLLTVNRQVLHWFALDDARAYAGAPVFIWMQGTEDDAYFYGFPPQGSPPRLKVAKEYASPPSAPDAIDRRPRPEESDAMYRRHVEGRLAGARSGAVEAAVCLYTLTPDRHFILDRHPGADRVFVVSACSGHGFKHSAGIGEAVAEVVTTGTSSVDLVPFALARFA